MPTQTDVAVQALQKGSRLFQFLDEPGRLRLAAIARVERYPKAQVIVREGDHSAAFYVILKGQVAVDADDGGRAKRLAVMNEGMFFGEMAVVTGEPRSATVTALADVELLAFDQDKVAAILKDYPKLRELLGKVGVLRSEDTLAKMMSVDDDLPPEGGPDLGGGN
jgi:CRP-like cAMP-binding protein